MQTEPLRKQSAPKSPRHAEWGRNIRSLRKALNLTQDDLAETLKVTQQSVSYWEKGVAAPRDDQKLAIAKALNSDVAYLFPLRAAS